MPPTEGLPDDVLRDKIRAALVTGVLPLIAEGAAWAGTAQGDHACACCRLPIRAGAPQYEPQEQPRLYAHLDCFMAWREESALLRQARGAEPGA